MLTIADRTSKALLEKILKLLNKGRIGSTDAWGIFSNHKMTDKLRAAGFTLSDEEILSLADLKRKVVARLKSKAKNRCAYCRRPMGTHAISWHIEHVRPKSKFPRQIFSLKNLVYACIDCNFTKNNNIDNKANYEFDIIDPAADGFEYFGNISYYQITTDHLHLIKYDPVSDSGKSTYSKLNLSRIETLEAVSGLNSDVRDIAHRIDGFIEKMEPSSTTEEVASFLIKLKLALAAPKS